MTTSLSLETYRTQKDVFAPILQLLIEKGAYIDYNCYENLNFTEKHFKYIKPKENYFFHLSSNTSISYKYIIENPLLPWRYDRLIYRKDFNLEIYELFKDKIKIDREWYKSIPLVDDHAPIIKNIPGTIFLIYRLVIIGKTPWKNDTLNL